MNRRNFLEYLTITGSSLAASQLPGKIFYERQTNSFLSGANEFSADVIICGGGLGACAAAIAALRNNLKVIMTEETDWLGGQVTQQGVPLDEHQWIETTGAPQSYRDFRNAIRQYYLRNYPLTEDAKTRKNLNPGDGNVSRLCCEPTVVISVLDEIFARYLSTRQLILLKEYKIVSADVAGSKVRSIKVKSTKGEKSLVLTGDYFIDGTELGEMLPLTGTEYVTGTESRKETNELHAPEKGDPKNEQAFTICFAIDHVPGENNVIEKPKEYNFWSKYVPAITPAWPGKQFDLAYSDPRTLKPKTLGFDPSGIKTGENINLWNYRKIANKNNFLPGVYKSDITIVNWPQHDYLLGNLTDVSNQEFNKHVKKAKELSLSLLYWLQTEVPRLDGGQGWPGLRLRKDVLGTEDGLAKYPYVRESRRIKAVFTILEEHVGVENRALITGKAEGNKAADFYDSVGIGFFRTDLHPTSGGNNYIDIGSLQYQIPLGALLPVRMENLIPACKNIGTTHITNGCYRLHAIEWSIGESAGMLASYAIKKKVIPHQVRQKKELLSEFQNLIRSQGIETHWRG